MLCDCCLYFPPLPVLGFRRDVNKRQKSCERGLWTLRESGEISSRGAMTSRCLCPPFLPLGLSNPVVTIEPSHVRQELHVHNFRSSLLHDGGRAWVVLFTDGLHCSPCRVARTNLLRVATSLRGLPVGVGVVDCERPANADFCRSHERHFKPPYACHTSRQHTSHPLHRALPHHPHPPPPLIRPQLLLAHALASPQAQSLDA